MATRKKPPKIVVRTVRLEEDLWDDLTRIAKERDSDNSKEIRKLIRRYVAKAQGHDGLA